MSVTHDAESGQSMVPLKPRIMFFAILSALVVMVWTSLRLSPSANPFAILAIAVVYLGLILLHASRKLRIETTRVVLPGTLGVGRVVVNWDSVVRSQAITHQPDRTDTITTVWLLGVLGLILFGHDSRRLEIESSDGVLCRIYRRDFRSAELFDTVRDSIEAKLSIPLEHVQEHGTRRDPW